MKVIIDQRESKKRISNVRDTLDSELIESEVATISVGDYLLINNDGGVIGAIEYKTYGDFVSSIINGHLESQLNDMDKYNSPYLFVVGSYGYWKKSTRGNINISKKSIEGFKVKVLCSHKTKLIQFDSEKEAIEAMVMILNRDKNKQADFVMPERHKSTGNPQLDMYLSIPNVGRVKAQTYSNVLPFYMFLTICKQESARIVFKKVYNLTVPDALIEYCRGL